MDRIRLFLRSLIGKKFVMAVTGLAMLGFLVMHVAGNLLLFAGDAAYNHYSHALISNPLVYVAEAGLVVLFVWHFATGLLLTKRNRDARPIAYQMKERAGGPSRKTLASTTMVLSGLVMLAFVPIHLETFKFGAYYDMASEPGVRDLRRLVLEVFQSPGYVVWYVVALVLLGFHAWHGFGSAFESLGVTHKKGLRRAGQLLALVITAGFLIIPIAIYLSEGKL